MQVSPYNNLYTIRNKKSRKKKKIKYNYKFIKVGDSWSYVVGN
jgi:hypothetical protein